MRWFCFLFLVIFVLFNVTMVQSVEYSDIDRTTTLVLTELDCESNRKDVVEVDLFIGEVNPISNLTIVNVTIFKIESLVPLKLIIWHSMANENGVKVGIGERSYEEIVEGEQYDFNFEWINIGGFYFVPHHLSLRIDAIGREFNGSVTLEIHFTLSGFEMEQNNNSGMKSSVGFKMIVCLISFVVVWRKRNVE